LLYASNVLGAQAESPGRAMMLSLLVKNRHVGDNLLTQLGPKMSPPYHRDLDISAQDRSLDVYGRVLW
jgi:hypothetical protein